MIDVRFPTGWTLSVLVVGMALLLPSEPRADQPYLSDLPKLYPTAFANWTKSLPYAIRLADWLTKLNGVESPIRDVTLHGVRFKFGTVCVPHDCGDNIAGVLFTPRQDRIVAVVQMHGQNAAPTIMTIGQMNNDEFACIRRFTDENQLAAC